MKTTLALTLAALAAALVDGSMLELQRGGDVWRIVTCHFTHWTYEQLAWDALAFVCLGLACERRHSGAFHATLLASIVLVPATVLLFDPRVAAYRGLSGIDSALFALLVVSTRNVFLGVLFAGKIALETITGGAVFAGGGFEVVPVAHVAGAVIGGAIAFFASRWRSCGAARFSPPAFQGFGGLKPAAPQARQPRNRVHSTPSFRMRARRV